MRFGGLDSMLMQIRTGPIKPFSISQHLVRGIDAERPKKAHRGVAMVKSRFTVFAWIERSG